MAVITAEDRYRIRETIDEELDIIIQAVRSTVDSTEIYTENEKVMGKSQFSGLSGVARETDSVEAVIAWIQYQIGRSKAGHGWRKIGTIDDAEKEFGLLVIAWLNHFRKRAKELSRDYGSGDNLYRSAVLKQFWIGMVRQFVGQMERYVVFRLGLTRSEKEPEHNE